MNLEHTVRQDSTCGKKVKITYVPFNHWLICDGRNPQKFLFTEGIIDYYNSPDIYIINKNGCPEKYKLEQIYQMVEVDELK